jgi:hypothetical protein
MAVVQISKIQLRRGQKNSQSGIPQLSSAEMAWAVDTQELFIGNGAVSEGAPYVGNTKILTEHDNLLELISGYRFGNDDPSILNSVNRSLQSKLDEYVSIADYGVISDGSTDCSDQFEQAFTDLFRNVDDRYKKTLTIPNGTYLLSRDIEIPSNARIQGESKTGSVLLIENNNIRLITESGSGLSEFNSTNRPQNIYISNLTIKRASGQVVLSGLRSSTFDNVLFEGQHFLGRSILGLEVEPSAIFWENNLAGTIVSDLHFNNCSFNQNSVSIKCLQSILTRSEISFNNCYFETGNTGVFIQGIQNQETNWKFFNCKFKEIEASTFRSTQGKNTIIESSSFINCGNGANNTSSPVTNIIFFGQKDGNLVIDCSFDRQQNFGIVGSDDVPSISEVYNSSFVNIIDRIRAPIFLSNAFIPLAILSSFNKFIYIRYVLTVGDYNRTGRITLVVDNSLSFVGITDDYIFSDNTALSGGGSIMSNFQFTAELRSNSDIVRLNTDDSSGSLDTVVLFYKNPILSGGDTELFREISFDVSYGA